MDQRTAEVGVGAIATTVGVMALLSPGRLMRAYGAAEPDDVGAVGWRLFGVRNVAIGGAMLAGRPWALRLAAPVQVPDALVFLQGMREGAMPRWSGMLALGTAAAVASLGLRATGADLRPGGPWPARKSCR